jgi:hypothetical protein
MEIALNFFIKILSKVRLAATCMEKRNRWR